MARQRQVNSGRKDSTERIRELVSILGSLSRAGDTVTIEALALRMGLSVKEASALMDIVCQASGEDLSGLLISANDQMTEFVLQYPDVHGRPVRLTEAETVAVVHALDTAKVPEDDPLRLCLCDAFSSADVEERMVRSLLGSASAHSDDAVYHALTLCARSQSEGQELRFGYKGLADHEHRDRRAVAQMLVRSKDTWYMEAIDLDLQEERTFRIDRMERVTLGDVIPHVDVLPRAESEECKRITLIFRDDTYLTVLDWPGLVIQNRGDEGITGELPYYGERSTWLIRRIAACGGAVVTDDTCIMDAARTYARELLRRPDIEG